MADIPRRWFLFEWRKFRGLTQEALGYKVGLTQGMISHLETGETDFTSTHLDLLSKALHCTKYDLLFRDPNNDNDPVAAIHALPESLWPLATKLLKQLQ